MRAFDGVETRDLSVVEAPVGVDSAHRNLSANDRFVAWDGFGPSGTTLELYRLSNGQRLSFAMAQAAAGWVMMADIVVWTSTSLADPANPVIQLHWAPLPD